MKRKIAVIGASGTIGKALTKALEEGGHEVVRISRSAGDQADIGGRCA